jgi:UDP:flavonoid glycosyltransferase YjiC (YdhE family)
MHLILASLGTGGDVYPYIGIGTRLQMRGHRVTLLASEDFQELASAEGFAFGALASSAEMEALLGNPDFWHPTRTARLSATWGAALLRRQYDLIADTAASRDCVLVANPGVVAARLVNEKLGCPLASVALQPWLIQSIQAPPVMPGRMYLPPWAPRVAHRLLYRLLNLAGGRLIGPALNRLRADLGLPPVPKMLFQWWWSEQRVLALFPEWYAPPQRDWLPQIRLTGFPLLDGRFQPPLSAEVLEFCRADQPPVVFTFGTGMMHARELFQAAGAACHDLGMRGIFLTRYASQLPEHLPDGVRHWPFLHLAQLLPHCSAIVHHGGIGTVVSALAAATPQLLIPFSYDQPDNAHRVRRMGAGGFLPQRLANGRNISRALAGLIHPTVQDRCQAISSRFDGVDGLEYAANWIEALVGATVA